MSPRPPPKISLRHDWTKELGSKVVQQPEGKVVQQPEGEVARQAKFFQPTQPIPSPNCDRSGQPDNTQGVFVVKGETSRSQEISVTSSNEELCSSDRSGQPDITQDVISVQTRSSEDSKSLNVEQTRDRSGQLDKHIVAVQDDPEVYHEAGTLNIDNETIRERIEADMDFKIPGLPHSIVKQAHSASVRELIQKIENHPNRHALQRDLRQSHSFNPFSPGSKQMIHEVGTSNCVNCSTRNPKRSAKYVYHTGTLASSTARAGTSYVKEERKIRSSSSTRWTSFPFLTTTYRKDDLTDTDTVRSQETRNATSPTSSRRSARRRTSRVSMIDL